MEVWSASRPGRFTPGERAPGTLWMDSRAGLDAVAKRKIPSPCRESKSGRPARRHKIFVLKMAVMKQRKR